MDEQPFTVALEQRENFEFSVWFDDPALAAITLDEPAPLGAGRGPNAARLLGAAVGHCLSASLLFCLRKSRVPVKRMRARVAGKIIRNERGRLRIGELRVELDPEIAPADRARVGKCLEIFEDFCIVTGSVRQGIDVSVAVVEGALGSSGPVPVGSAGVAG
jgi:organic hydroperoxide reductase OsmC/OhrA